VLADPKLLSNIPKAWHSDTIQRRIIGGSSPAVRYVFESARVKPTRFLSLAQASMMPMQYVDAYGTALTAAVVYTHHYNDAIKAGATPAMAEKLAADEMSYAVYNYSQPIDTANRSVRETQANIVTRTIMMFMSDARLKTALNIEAAKLGKSNPARATSIVGLSLLSALAAQTLLNALRDATTDDPDEEIWNADNYGKAALQSFTGGLFLANSAISGVYSWFTGASTYGGGKDLLFDQTALAIRAGKNYRDAFDTGDPDAMLKEWDVISRAIAVTPGMAAPAVLINALQTLRGAQNNFADWFDGGWTDKP
jgi:hypothetical protein